ncbi:hypothetical protein BX265_4964 [Streptomyces sp. TLI_235]|nr:DUF6221 family protein [Streptomyces sp. TLI_235]PBC80128.1 hypothetical protein BX265_4964 [Streptomyces sp. TLI_235]
MSDDLVAFLLARIDDEERAAQAVKQRASATADDAAEDCIREYLEFLTPTELLAHLGGQREALNRHRPDPSRDPDYCSEDLRRLPCPALRLMAFPYTSHPEFRKEWIPRALRPPRASLAHDRRTS